MGRPLAQLLTARDGTVALCHSRTEGLPALTPVPGGVGPMTRACLPQNVLRAARLRRRL